MREQQVFTRPSVNGTGPDARCAHSSALCGNLFVFGGWNGRQMLNDMYVLYLGLFSYFLLLILLLFVDIIFI